MGTGENLPAIDPQTRDDLIDMLGSRNRRERQEAAAALHDVANEDPDTAATVAPALVEALGAPEAQTRWQCLEALSAIALTHPDAVVDGFEGAEESLFDDNSSSVRLAAFRFLTRYGAISPECAGHAWPVINEAVQCYHGDSEYRDMLICLRDFAQGNIGPEVAAALAQRMAYDAKSGRGFIRAYSAEISSIARKA